MKRHLRRIEKDLHNDYIIKYPFEKLTNRPKLEKITAATNLNNKSLGNIYKTDKSDEIKDRMRVIYLYYLKIFGQTPKIIKIKRSVAGWNIRKGMENGVQVTLRRSGRMESWFKRWKYRVLPRIILLKWSDLNINDKNKKDLYTSSLGLPSQIGMSPIGGLIRKKVIKTEEGEKTLKELKAGLQEKGLRLSFTVKGGQERSFIMSYYGLPTK